jgi:hypothetical protein
MSTNQDTCKFPNSWCLDSSFIVGLSANMSAVHNSSRICDNQQQCLTSLCEINNFPGVAWVTFRMNRNYKLVTTKEKCKFPNSWCLDSTTILGLSSNMTVVHNATRSCHNQQQCLTSLCEINDVPGVAWVIFRINY